MRSFDQHSLSPQPLGFVTITGLADQLDTTPRTIRRWVQSGQLPAPARLGRSAYWNLDAIREALSGKGGIAG